MPSSTPFVPPGDGRNASALTEWVQIQRDYGTGKDKHGARVRDWRLLTGAYAKVLPLSGREYWEANRELSQVAYRVEMRAVGTQATLTGADRLLWRGKILYLQTPQIDYAAEWLIVMASETAPSP